ncbi:MAG: tRNA (N(6)-L-threonylcarbamoyladenosine(37)-C(2))-methylthiotransferase MtaB [Syntrophales bacterium]
MTYTKQPPEPPAPAACRPVAGPGEERGAVRVAVATLGCKVNQCESAWIAEALAAPGVTVVPFDQEADCYIVNTCTVTQRSDTQSRQLIRRAVRRNPAAAVCVTGCYAQRAPAEIARIPGVSLVAGTAEKERIPELVRRLSPRQEPRLLVGDIGITRGFSRLGATAFPDHTRAFLKIQDGCDARCSYCIVPSARGPSRSLPPGEVAQGVAALAGKGYREVVLTGIHLGAYGRDLVPPENLAAVIRQCAETGAVERLRLSSIEPREVTDELIDLVASSGAVCRHLHIPLQSGDDGILAAMHRDYRAAFFRGLVERLHEAVPGIAVGIDVMAGFPGETEAAFANTLRLVEELPVAYLHVFPYSRRPGTPAASLPGQVDAGEKKRRTAALRLLADQKRRAFATRFIGEPLAVLVESRADAKTGLALGFSDNYIPVAVRGDAPANRVVRVTPVCWRDGRLVAGADRG